VQILNENQILSLKKYVQDNQLNIDLKSLEEGNGVLIIHDHMLSPEQQKLADEVIGEPVYFCLENRCRKESGKIERKSKGSFQRVRWKRQSDPEEAARVGR